MVHYWKELNNDLIVPEKIISTIFLLLSTKTSYFNMLLRYLKYYDNQINTLLYKELKNLLRKTKAPTY